MFCISLTDLVLASPQARVVNNCPFTIYLQSVQTEASHIEELTPGDVYTEELKLALNGTGVSIKISRSIQALVSAVAGAITQLEYAYTPWMLPYPDVYYDVSDIDDRQPRQFCDYGFALQGPRVDCPTVTCPPDCGNFCAEVYNKPKDDYATRACQSGGTGVISLAMCVA
jgi:hypothetical protein